MVRTIQSAKDAKIANSSLIGATDSIVLAHAARSQELHASRVHFAPLVSFADRALKPFRSAKGAKNAKFDFDQGEEPVCGRRGFACRVASSDDRFRVLGVLGVLRGPRFEAIPVHKGREEREVRY